MPASCCGGSKFGTTTMPWCSSSLTSTFAIAPPADRLLGRSIKAQIAVQQRLGREALDDERAGGRPHCLPALGGLDQLAHAGGKGAMVLDGKEQPRVAVLHVFGDAANSAGDDRHAGRL